MSRRRQLGSALVAALLTAGATALGNPLTLEISLGDVQGDDWRAEGIALALGSPEAGLARGQLTLDRLTLPAPIGTLDTLVVRCGRLDYDFAEVRCADAHIDAGLETLGLRRIEGDIQYRVRERAIHVDLQLTHTTLGPISASGNYTQSEWTLTMDALALPLDALLALRPPSSDTDPLTVTGATDLHIDIAGAGAAFSADIHGTSRQLTVSNTQGTLASDGVTLGYEGTASWPGASTDAADFTLSMSATAGEAYVEPIYVNLADHPGRLQATGSASATTIILDHLSFSLRDLIDSHSTGRVSLGRSTNEPRWHVHELPLAFDPMVLPSAYTVLLQPFLAGTDLADLDTTGQLAGEVRIVDDQAREAHLVLRELHAEDRDGRLAIYGLKGEIDRLEDGRLQPRWLSFDGGFLYGLGFGEQRADFDETSKAPGWRLTRPIDVPVLDGYLHLERLELMAPATARAPPTISLDASLTDIGMRAVASALGWPPLAGTLSGRIPSVTYENGDIAIAGTLEAEVFGGHIAIEGLRVREPFGNRAVARADVHWRQLDLEELSSTFSFGRMSGRVDGYLDELVLLNWSPLRFDGALFTSPGDRRRHRISQRAVDNIASLGGGASNAVSSTFLRFFEDFGYDELRLACRLEDGVCHMSGLEQVLEENGQVGYLVLRGRGLPRLKVVGHADRVDWPRFLAQLRSITEPGGDISVER